MKSSANRKEMQEGSFASLSLDRSVGAPRVEFIKVSRTYNMVNPGPTTWASLIKTILQRLGSDIRVVELNEWVHMLEQIDQTDTRQLASKPAAKILDFFRAFETVKREGKVNFGTRPMQLPLARLWLVSSQ